MMCARYGKDFRSSVSEAKRTHKKFICVGDTQTRGNAYFCRPGKRRRELSFFLNFRAA